MKTEAKGDEKFSELEKCVYEMKADHTTISKLVKIDYKSTDLQLAKLLSRLGTHEFDVFELRQRTGGNELVGTGNYLMVMNDLFEKLNITKWKYIKYLTVIQDMYNHIPYHNKTHATDVC